MQHVFNDLAVDRDDVHRQVFAVAKIRSYGPCLAMAILAIASNLAKALVLFRGGGGAIDGVIPGNDSKG
jgi:hypothetical protein